MTPKVSIIVPCYNQGKYLPETLDSVLAQSYTEWECVIVNDGSADNTAEVAKSYCDKDNRFRYVGKENGGLSSARNAGIKASTGKYILPLDSDDKIGARYLEAAVEVLEKNEDIGVVYCRAEFFEHAKGEWHIEPFSLEKILGSNLFFCTSFFRRADYDRTSGYNENMKNGFEDWDFWLSLVELDVKVHQIDEILFYYRVRRTSALHSRKVERMNIARKQIWENHRKLYAENYLNPRLTTEYKSLYNSREYQLGKKIMRPIRKLLGRQDVL